MKKLLKKLFKKLNPFCWECGGWDNDKYMWLNCRLVTGIVRLENWNPVSWPWFRRIIYVRLYKDYTVVCIGGVKKIIHLHWTWGGWGRGDAADLKAKVQSEIAWAKRVHKKRTLETMGDLEKVVIKNKSAEIVACLYKFEDGSLHPDSWMRTEGEHYDRS